MAVPQEDYLAHVIELRDAGKQLMHLFEERVLSSKNAAERNRIRRNFLETELYVLQLEEVLSGAPPKFSP